MGKLYLIRGPMYSGKTTFLLGVYLKYTRPELGNRVAVVKHQSDTRYETGERAHSPIEFIYTHDLKSIPATHSVHTLTEIEPELKTCDIVIIDEGHFFADIKLADTLADMGKTVFVSTLDTDFNRKKIETIAALTPDRIISLQGKCCFCKKSASFNIKISGNMSAVLEVGKDDMYKTVCRSCHIRESKNTQQR